MNDERRRITRDLQRLDMARMRGGLRQSEYERLRSVLMRQMNELNDGELDVQIARPGEKPRTVKTVSFSFDMNAVRGAELTMSEFRKTVAKLMEQQVLGLYSVDRARKADETVYLEPPAPTMIWEEFGGVIVCECDNADCFERITISREDYFKASGRGGYARLTSPNCAYGILGARLIDRAAHWLVWTK